MKQQQKINLDDEQHNNAVKLQDDLKDDLNEKQQPSDHHQSNQLKTSPSTETNKQQSFTIVSNLYKFIRMVSLLIIRSISTTFR